MSKYIVWMPNYPGSEAYVPHECNSQAEIADVLREAMGDNYIVTKRLKATLTVTLLEPISSGVADLT